MAERHLAQINVGTLIEAEGHEKVSGFFDNLDRINALAEASDGFIWRLTDEESNNATGIAIGTDPKALINISIWRDLEALRAFVYRTAHAQIMANRADWFIPHEDAFQALWWIAKGQIPTPEDALARLDHLRANGPSETAFTFATAKNFGA